MELCSELILCTAQKKKFSISDFVGKYEPIHRNMCITFTVIFI